MAWKPWLVRYWLKSQGEVARVRLSNPKDYRPNLNITVANQKLEVHYIDTGVPHTIVFVDGLQEVNVNSLGCVDPQSSAFCAAWD